MPLLAELGQEGPLQVQQGLEAAPVVGPGSVPPFGLRIALGGWTHIASHCASVTPCNAIHSFLEGGA